MQKSRLQQEIEAHAAAALRALEEEPEAIVFRNAWPEEDEEITIVTIKPLARRA